MPSKSSGGERGRDALTGRFVSMLTYDNALVEKAAETLRGLERAWGHAPDATGIDSNDAARAVLDAVADDLRAEGRREGYDKACEHDTAICRIPDQCFYNPYRRERA